MTTELHDARVEAMTLEAWAALDEDAPGEFVDGYLVEDEVPNNLHEAVVMWLARVLGTWAAAHGAFAFASGAKFAVSKRRGRMPDVSMYLASDPRPPRGGLNRRPPSIAVEVVSPTPRDARRDRIEKRHDYAAFGVRWYWIVDPQARTIEIQELDAQGRYVLVADGTDGLLEHVPGCDGLALDLSALWAEIDKLGPEEP